MNDFTTEIVQTELLMKIEKEKLCSITKTSPYWNGNTFLTKIIRCCECCALVLIQVIRETVLTFDQSKPNMVN
ncbi:hypothetical protein EfmJHP35_20010 [Enterococcus faecium]|nr:hypothetical protein EfmJHP35_20010 [Enterococcus faecium]